MTSKPINLNQVRKQKARAEKRARAEANAAKHGRSKEERLAARAVAEKDRHRLELHRMETLDAPDQTPQDGPIDKIDGAK